MIDSTVFVIDDDEGFCSSLDTLLTTINLKCESYCDAKSFLSKFDPNKSGCILVDLRLPGMDGLQLLDELNKRNCICPVIFITAYGEVPIAVKALKKGAFDFIEKPYSPQILIESINEAIDKDQNQRQKNAKFGDVAHKLKKITSREREVLTLIINGMSSKEVAQTLNISINTVENHRSSIMRKMEVNTIAKLIKMVTDFTGSEKDN